MSVMNRLALFAVLAALACCDSKPAPLAGSAAPPAAPAAPAAPSRATTVTFHSDALGVDKQFVVYLPASYAASTTRRYPVFYYLNGLGGDETNWVQGGHIDRVADSLTLDAIIVMPDGDDSFYLDSAEPIDYEACKKDGA